MSQAQQPHQAMDGRRACNMRAAAGRDARGDRAQAGRDEGAGVEATVEGHRSQIKDMVTLDASFDLPSKIMRSSWVGQSPVYDGT